MDELDLNPALLDEVGRDICIRCRTYPVAMEEGILVFAAQNPNDELLREALQLRAGREVGLRKADGPTLEYQLKRIIGKSGPSGEGGILSDLIKSEVDINEGSSLEEIKKKSQSEPVIKLVNNLVNQAILEIATDIHIEPGENLVKVRYRKDGMLKDSMELPKWVQASLTSRIKILAELDIAEKRLPQDGRIKWMHEGEAIDMRVSTLPTRVGEKVVIRILKHVESVGTLETLGMSPEVFTVMRQLIHRPQGMLFVTGPTGSGKSSTLYAALKEILEKDINVSTIEDPIEYRLEGANQVQINEKAGLNFASALRSLLRQDPDVMMVGEIRDEETAAIAVQAAQTGHLVFSTLHTNDAASAVTRLQDLKIKPFLISSAVLGVLSQRLVRKLCKACFTLKPPTADEKIFLPMLPDMCPTPVGCPACNGTGYRGRTGIFELLQFDSQIREAILGGKSEAHIKKSSNYKQLVMDGMDKLKENITSAGELIRVAVMEAQT
ncbi:MAG: GspE/PulE family protein [Fibrobacterota bacterium]|nr:GspE/PulE family protein [Fibrobacterota bacterium]